MGSWKRNESGTDWTCTDGSWLEYGAFGRDTYGLHYVGDPDVVYKVYSPLSIDVPEGYDMLDAIDQLINRIESER